MTLKVGAGKACISPSAECFPFPTFGGGKPRSAIHDDIYTRAVVIDNGKTRAAIVNFDMVAIPVFETTRKLIAETGGIPEENVFMTATHNHDAPSIRSPQPGAAQDEDLTYRMGMYTNIVLDGVKQAVKDAVDALRPAKYGFGTGESWINVNRDFQFEDGYWMQGPNFKAYADKTLAVMKFLDEEDKLIAAVLNYGCHAVLGFVAEDTDGAVKVSADWPGVTQKFVETRFGDGAVCVWTPAAEGNLNPVYNSALYTFLEDGYAVMTQLPPGAPFVLMEALGGQHAIDAIKVINETCADKDTMEIKYARTEIDLPSQKPPVGADMMHNRMLVDNLLPLGPNGERPEKKLVVMEDDPEHPFVMEIKILQLGDVAWVGVPCEIYSEIGRDMKAASPCPNTVVVTHTNTNYHSYIPDKTAADHHTFQSYGAAKPGACDEYIVKGMVELFKDLK